MEDREFSPVVDSVSEVAEPDVIDEASQDEAVADVRYEIASYGWDADVEGLVRRLERDEILIPEFQRSYIWTLPEASRLIESLLLGLPVPGIFLAEEPETNKHLVIDGQQRLRSLEFFYDGYFNPKPDQKRQRVFSLQKVQPEFEGKTYASLEERDRRRLDNSIIPATIVKQLSPKGDDTSIYHIFERLNSGGRKLAAQEIRVAIFHGGLMNFLRQLNEYGPWREIFGKPNPRLKDEELILRFIALYHCRDKYSRPMSEFLNRFALEYKNPDAEFLERSGEVFKGSVDAVLAALGSRAFRPERALNAAVFDSVMVGVAERLDKIPIAPGSLRVAYQRLLSNPEYVEKVSRSTADEAFLEFRLAAAVEAFGGIESEKS